MNFDGFRISFTLLFVAVYLHIMNTLAVWLIFLLAAESTVSGFTDFENGMFWVK